MSLRNYTGKTSKNRSASGTGIFLYGCSGRGWSGPCTGGYPEIFMNFNFHDSNILVLKELWTIWRPNHAAGVATWHHSIYPCPNPAYAGLGHGTRRPSFGQSPPALFMNRSGSRTRFKIIIPITPMNDSFKAKIIMQHSPIIFSWVSLMAQCRIMYMM